jgi:gliding motility-associatede transport system auxiliary component
MASRIFNIIGWIGTALVVAAVGVRFNLIPVDPQWAIRLAAAGLVCMLAYMASQWREILAMFAGRQARYGTLAGVGVLVVLGILVALNYIGTRQNKRWDFTANQQYSLSDQTRNVLAKLDDDLQILVFAQETDFNSYRDRLREYEYASKRVSTQYIDPDKQRTLAQQDDVQQYGTIIFKYKGRTERATQNTEQDLTNGIIKVVSGQQRKVYFVQGHDEKDPTSSEREGYGTIADALKKENYTVDKLVLAQTGAVPDDAAVVVVAGPKGDLFAPETEALKKYMDKQGKVLLLLDPPAKLDGPEPKSLIQLAHDWGIDVGNDIVVDVSGMGRLIGTDASVPVAAKYPTHPITDRFNLITAYPLARSVVAVSGGVNGHTAQSFIESSERSWAESDLKSLLTSGDVALDASKGDKAGPVSMAAAVTAAAPAPADAKPEDKDAPKPETRLAVVGDSDFASNAVLGIQGNRDIFMNTVGWLSQQENLISIRPREAADRRITLTATQQSWITWISLVFVPAAVFGTGILTWMRRR